MTQAVIQTTVTGMQGRPIATTVPAANQAYTWSGTAWVPTGPYLPLAGGVVSGALRLQFAQPVQIFNDTGTSITAGGLWRELNSAGNLNFQANTATAGDFSTATTPLQLAPNGNVQVGASLGAGGGVTASGNLTAGGNLAAQNAFISGAIGVGGASLAAGAAVNFPGGSWLNNAGGNGGWGLYTGSGAYTFLCQNAVDPALQFNSNSGSLMNVNSGGSMTLRGTLSQGSDATTKTNINLLTQGISLVRQLLPKSFQRNEPVNAPVQWGFIAQDVEPVIPDAVSANLMVEGGPNLLSLDITAILAAVTMAVKQLDQRCTALETHDGITPPTGALA